MVSKRRRPQDTKNDKFTVASLFTGCGGLDLGFIGNFSYRKKKYIKPGFEIVFANDIDSNAAEVYEANKKYFNGHRFLRSDIKEVDCSQIPEFDVLLAGFPCQPFSNAGKRQGIHDEDGRGTLFYECEKVIRACQERSDNFGPLAFVYENVRGIMSTRMPNGDTVPNEIVKRMKRLGFNAVCKLLNASEYGTPQNRYRVIVIGTREDLPLFDFASLDEVIETYGLPSTKKDPYDLYLGSVLCDIPESAPHAKEYWKYSPGGQSMIEKIGTCDDGGEAIDKFKKRIPLHRISPTVSKGRSWKNIPVNNMSPRFRKIWDDPKKYRAPNFYRRFALGEICGTITASAQPENCGITHPFEDRRFTIREVARIQTFPDDFVFPYKSISNAYKLIGNAVPPVFGWVIAQALKNHLRRCHASPSGHQRKSLRVGTSRWGRRAEQFNL